MNLYNRLSMDFLSFTEPSLQGPEYILSKRKRQMDVLGASALFAALSPVIASGLVASLAVTSASPIFRQERYGKDGKLFVMNKIRTIPPHAVEETNGAQYGNFDPRTGKLGNLMRTLNIDEMLQVINIIAGDMSLVNIRGVTEKTIERLEDADPILFMDWWECYTLGRPGLCGPGQDMPKDGPDADRDQYVRAMIHDIKFVENACFKNDMKYLQDTPKKLAKVALKAIGKVRGGED